MTDKHANALHVLILEDVQTDAELMQRALHTAGLVFIAERVETREGFTRAIEGRVPDIILADYKLPKFDGMAALAIARAACPDVPFVFVTGSLGDERAVEALKQGAVDYILKDRLSRLAPAVVRALEVARARTEHKRTEHALERFAHYDALTGLPNRLLFTDRLQQAISHATRHERLVGVALLDLDQFKKINDTLGHQAGDALLKQVSERLEATLRPGDTIARMGGDEFTLVLADMAQADDATLVLQKIHAAFETPFQVEGDDLFITASTGITLFPIDDLDVQALLRNADIAMYRAKESGRNNWQFYTAEMTAKANENLVIEQALRGALERNELTLHYQPQVSLADGRVTGVEALLRWHHPQLGNITPDRFIPIAEETGMIVAIGEWVLRTACEQARCWHAAGFTALRMAVNLSSRQLHEPSFPETVERILVQTGCPAELLELELTESTLLHNVEGTIVTLDKLNLMGARFAIDDFGTGYSSFAYLRRFPLNVLKIDQTFTRHVASSADTAAIVRAIITMARALGLETVAEGVETSGQKEFLTSNGCDVMQGYYFSRPQPAEIITGLLHDGQRRAPAAAEAQG